MPTKKIFAHSQDTRVPKDTAVRETASRLQSPAFLSDLENLDEESLLSLCVNTPARLTPPPGNVSRTSESSNNPLSRMQVSNGVMEATLKKLGFGPPDDLSLLPISVSPSTTNSEISITDTFGHEDKVPAAKEPETAGVSGSDDLDAYDQISELFQQIAQRTGHSVDSLILEWALLHAHSDLVKKRVAHGLLTNAMTARQQAFEEEANKVIKLGSRLADVGIDIIFVMVEQDSAKNDGLGKIWSTPGLQGMFKELSLSDNEIVAAARMYSHSSMWSQFREKYKQDHAKRPLESDDKTAAETMATDSYVAKQSAAAASAFLTGPHKKRRDKKLAEDGLSSAKGGTPSSPGPSNSGSRHVPSFAKNERSALGVLQDTLIGRY